VEEEVLEKAPEARPAPARQAAAQERAWLTESLLEMSPTRPQRRTLDFFLSMFVHTLLLGVLLLIPLYFTEAIDLSQFTRTFLVAPPPPPPPPPPPSPSVVKVAAKAPRRVFTVAGKLVAPVAIPQKVAMIKEDQLPPDIGGGVGVVGGVPGGVPGGQIGGVLGGIITGAQRSAIPEAPSAAPKAPIRVGGRVKMPRALYSPDPMYPPLARQARIQGDVQIDAVIDPAGNVVEMQVLSGHPLLIPAALEALRKWKYQPSYLNEEPVSVQLVVTIRFRLN
jgi:protein TonB